MKKVRTKIEDRTKVLATKEDLYIVKSELKQAKIDMIKWFFAMFITLALMIIGLYFKG